MQMTVDNIYKYRWLLSLLINMLILAGMLTAQLIPDFQTIKINQEMKQKMITELAQIKQTKAVLRDNDPLPPHVAIEFLLKFIEKHELQLQFINQLDSALQLQVKGRFIQVSAFVLNLYRVNANIITYQLMSDAAQDSVTVKMNLNVMTENDKNLTILNKYPLRNPFCLKSSPALKLNAQTISVNKFKWAGYLDYNDQAQALLLLPDHSIITVKVNDQVGLEQAIVHLITPSHVRLLLPNKTFINLAH